jgi:hypothetical protein
MEAGRRLKPKAEVIATLRRAEMPEATIEALEAELEDPVDLDLDRDLGVLVRYGITRSRLEDELGGSP